MKSNIRTAVDVLVISTATNDLARSMRNPHVGGPVFRPSMKTRAAVLRKAGLSWEIMDGKNIRGVIVHRH